MTVATALGKQLHKKKWTQEQAAEALGISRFSVNQLCNGRRGVTAHMALELERVFDIPAEKWMELQARQDLEQARNGKPGRFG